MGKGGKKSETSKQEPNRKTKAAVDPRQNNRMLRRCPSGIAQRPPHHEIAVPTAMQNSHKDNVRSSAIGKQLKQKKSNSLSLAQHHLSALNFFWASFFVRVQLTSLFLISPGLCSMDCVHSNYCTLLAVSHCCVQVARCPYQCLVKYVVTRAMVNTTGCTVVTGAAASLNAASGKTSPTLA